MWYPNTAQWRVIWAVAVVIGILGLMSLDRGGGFFLFALFFDAGVLIWWLQRHGQEKPK